MARARKFWVEQKTTPAYRARLCSAAEGRNSLPDILQDAACDKTITGVTRYMHPLVAVVPIEAILLLAGELDTVDEATRIRIQNSALNLLAGLPHGGG